MKREQARIGAAEVKDQISGARNRRRSEGHRDEGRGTASRRQAVAEKVYMYIIVRRFCFGFHGPFAHVRSA